MFEYLKEYNNIIVTGPHRSGTTICAAMIAYDLGKKFVIERDIATPRFKGDTEPDLNMEQAKRWLQKNDNVVLQGATCFRWIEQLQMPDLATVYIRRDYDEVIRSQIEYRKRQLDDPESKFNYWCANITNIENPYTVNYEDLKDHHMFRENRDNWKPRQIND